MEYIKGLDSQNLDELLDDIRFKIFAGKWTGITFFKGLDLKPKDYSILFRRDYDKILIEKYFTNPYFKILPGQHTRLALSYEDAISQWFELVHDRAFEYDRGRNRVLKVKTIKTLNQECGSYYCNDVRVLQGFLYWWKFKEQVFKKFNRYDENDVMPLLDKCLEEAEHLIKEYGPFMVLADSKDSNEHFSFDEIFMILSGDHYASYYKDDNLVIMSGVMK